MISLLVSGILVGFSLEENAHLVCERTNSMEITEFGTEYLVEAISPSSPVVVCFIVKADSEGDYDVIVRSSSHPLSLYLLKNGKVAKNSETSHSVSMRVHLISGIREIVVLSYTTHLRFNIGFYKVPLSFKVRAPFLLKKSLRNGGAVDLQISIMKSGTYLLRVKGYDFKMEVKGPNFVLKYPRTCGEQDAGLYLEKGDIVNLKVEVMSGEKSRLSYVEMKRITDPEFVREFEIECGGEKKIVYWKTSEGEYRRFKNSWKSQNPSEFGRLVMPGQVATLVDEMKKLCRNRRDLLHSILSFVQSLDYIPDDVWGEYPKFPIETLAEGGGDCEDKAILLTSMLVEAGFKATLLHISGHVAVGVDARSVGIHCDNEIKGRFCYVEASSPGWSVGEIPREVDISNMEIVGPNWR